MAPIDEDQPADWRQQLKQVEAKIANLKDLSAAAYPELAKRQKHLQELIAADDRRQHLQAEIKAAETLLNPDQPDLNDLAESEIKSLKQQLADLEAEISPKNQPTTKPVIVEIRAGIGGAEASLFAADLYRMYYRYSEAKSWNLNLISQQTSDAGGFKEIIFRIEGSNASLLMGYEAGVHRVQRVPQTESQGRVHTSTATVAVLAASDPTEVDINPDDLKIETFRSSGPGGQSVNKTSSAVRITHKPTGISASCQNKSQLRNRQEALAVLRARLNQRRQAKLTAATSSARATMVAQADRSQKIRTYNYRQDRVTDHRLGGRNGQVSVVLDGNLADLHDQLQEKS